MAAEILLKPSEAREHANRMRDAAGQSRDAFESLHRSLGTLSDSFRGQAQVAFESRYTDWNAGATQAIEALEGLERWLNQAATTLEDTDAQLSSGLQ